MRILLLEHERSMVRMTRPIEDNVVSLECEPFPVWCKRFTFFELMQALESEYGDHYSVAVEIRAKQGR